VNVAASDTILRALFDVAALASLIGFRLAPQAPEAGHLARGDRYFTEQRDRRSGLRVFECPSKTGTNTRGIRQLGLASTNSVSSKPRVTA